MLALAAGRLLHPGVVIGRWSSSAALALALGSGLGGAWTQGPNPGETAGVLGRYCSTVGWEGRGGRVVIIPCLS